jgi:hypothetical protein
MSICLQRLTRERRSDRITHVVQAVEMAHQVEDCAWVLLGGGDLEVDAVRSALRIPLDRAPYLIGARDVL